MGNSVKARETACKHIIMSNLGYKISKYFLFQRMWQFLYNCHVEEREQWYISPYNNINSPYLHNDGDVHVGKWLREVI